MLAHVVMAGLGGSGPPSAVLRPPGALSVICRDIPPMESGDELRRFKGIS
jgi:hypothetical protein